MGFSAGWSNTAYQSGLARWSSWCAKRQIDPISGDVQHFLEFLVGLYDQGLQHRSINSNRSAVSMTHKQVDSSPIGQHPLVNRLLKGVYNQRPPQPRYSATWDVDVVTKHLALCRESFKGEKIPDRSDNGRGMHTLGVECNTQ
jgi:hypothetical protein